MTNELILNSNNIGVNTTRKSLTKKKKGFTLVELIAVIAILAILAAIIVPRVANYTAKASNAKYLADAKTIANAVEAYNADNTDPTKAIIDGNSLSDIKGKLMSTDTDKSKDYLSTFPTSADEFKAFGGDGTKTDGSDVTYTELKQYITDKSK